MSHLLSTVDLPATNIAPIINCPNSRGEDQCGAHTERLEQPMSVCASGVGKVAIGGDHVEYS